MNLVRDVANELLGMFVGDAGLSGAILAVVTGSALLIKTEVVSTQLGGGLLFVGCLAILIGSVFRASGVTADWCRGGLEYVRDILWTLELLGDELKRALKICGAQGRTAPSQATQ